MQPVQFNLTIDAAQLDDIQIALREMAKRCGVLANVLDAQVRPQVKAVRKAQADADIAEAAQDASEQRKRRLDAIKRDAKAQAELNAISGVEAAK